jgi:hypothetical protein
MANTYAGPVDLIDGDGNLVEAGVHAELASRQDGRSGLVSWTGILGPDADDSADWTSATIVRLPSGKEGNVIPSKVKLIPGGSSVWKVARLEGSDDPPF